LSYEHWTEEAREEILQSASQGSLVCPTGNYSFNKATLNDMRLFFESLTGLCVGTSAEELMNVTNYLNLQKNKEKNLQEEQISLHDMEQSIRNEKTRIEIQRKEIAASKESLLSDEQVRGALLKRCKEDISSITTRISTLQSWEATKTSDLNTANEAKARLCKERNTLSANIRQHEATGETDFFHTCKYTVTKTVDCSYGEKCDSISASSTDDSKIEITSKSYEKGTATVKNCNWFYDAAVVVTYTGKTKYKGSWQNMQKELYGKRNQLDSDIKIQEENISTYTVRKDQLMSEIQYCTASHNVLQGKLRELENPSKTKHQMVRDSEVHVEKDCLSLKTLENQYQDQTKKHKSEFQRNLDEREILKSKQATLFSCFRKKVFDNLSKIQSSTFLQKAMLDNHSHTWESFFREL